MDVSGELGHIQKPMSHISQQLMEVIGKETVSQRDKYHTPTLFAKVDLPRFMRDDAVGWVSKCESYFDLDRIGPEKGIR